jgi:GAF domain-containing protein
MACFEETGLVTKLKLDFHNELEERLRFETLLTDISARFVNLPADHVDREIEDAQRAICECLGIDHSSLWQVASEDVDQLLLAHLYRAPDLPTPPQRMSGSEYFPWSQNKLQGKEIVSVPDTAKPPPEAARARDMETWRHFAIKSTLAFPLSAGGGPVIGVLTFDATREKRDWPEPLQKQLQLIAQVFANALDRKRAEERLRESEARLSGGTLSERRALDLGSGDRSSVGYGESVRAAWFVSWRANRS